MDIHHALKAMLDIQDYDKAIEMMGSYGEKNDINEIKMILILVQSFKDHPILGLQFRRLSDIFDRKIVQNEKE